VIETIPSQAAELSLRFPKANRFSATCLAALLLAVLPAMAAERQVLSGHLPKAVASSRMLYELPAATRLNLAIGLPLRNQAQLDSFLAQLTDPASPNFRHYLTAPQFAAKFGPTEQDYHALIAFAQENGLTVTATHPNRVLLDVSGEASQIEKVFHLKMMVYLHPVRGKFFGPDREPSLDLDTKVLDISGLDNLEVPHPMGLKTVRIEDAKSYVTGSGPGEYFIGQDFRAAYAPGVALTGSGQVVGLLEFDGFFASDEQQNAAQAGLPVVPTQTVLLDGFNGVPGGANIEVILDIMMASYMAPGLSNILVYEGEIPNDILNRMATDNLAQQLSSSWGYGYPNPTTEQIFEEFIAQGQSMLQASGDSGAYENGVMPPSDDPNLTVAGGTSLTTAGASGPWQSESVWSGSGGGVSTVYSIPSYQQGLNMAANGGSTQMRNIPDVGLTADIQMFLIQSDGQGVVVGGTSAAAPLWTGFIALANQQAAANAEPRVGFLNPLLYAIGNSSNYGSDFHDITTGSNGGYSAVTGYDLTTGWGSPAGQHLIYDLTATSGTPSFALSSSSAALSINQSSTGAATLSVIDENGFTGSVGLATTGLPAGVTAAFSPVKTAAKSVLTFTSAASASPGNYPVTIAGISGSLSSTTTINLTVVAPNFSLSASVANLTVPQNSTGTSKITVGSLNGFSGAVGLSATGLPPGLTAAFSPASTKTTSVLTLTASSTAALGTYPVTVAGISGSLNSTTTINLTVVAPNFSLSASVASLTVPQSSTGTSKITVGSLNGFSSAVALSATGLPTGLTAAFSPASTKTTSVLTLTASSTAALGTYPVTVTGISGSLNRTTIINLTVVAPNFSLSASVASLIVPQSSTGTSKITIGSLNGFSGAVGLSATGLPPGLTAAFSPASTKTTSVLTLTASSTAALGTYPVTVAGISGSLNSTTTINLTVVAPNFSLSVSVASLTVPRSSTGTSKITVSSLNGFGGAVGLSATGLPPGLTAAFSPVSTKTTSVLTLTASSIAAPGTYPVTVTGISGTLNNTATLAVTITAPNFTLSFLPTTVAVPSGSTAVGTVTLTGQNGFKGAVSLTASGLPKGVTVSWGALSASGTILATFTTSSTATAGSYSVVLTGVSGALTNSVPFTLTVLAPTTGTSPVNLSPGYNVNGLAMDGIPFTGAGLDGGLNGSSTAYSGNLVGMQQTIAGSLFFFGPAGALDAVSGKTVLLPAGKFSTLCLLATGVNGGQFSQLFKVTYSDGTSSTFSQSLSDWFVPQNFPGESDAMIMPYRDNGPGQIDNRTFYLYEYAFALNASKTVASVAFPNNRNVVILAATLSSVSVSAK
jgi:uncharacterized membrane protein